MATVEYDPFEEKIKYVNKINQWTYEGNWSYSIPISGYSMFPPIPCSPLTSLNWINEL